MKKTLAIAAMFAMVPFAAHAKSTISDYDMGKVTGQAGVSIDLDVRVDVKADTIAWGQNDGAGTTSWIGMKNFKVDNLTVKLRPELLQAVVTDTLAGAALAADPTNGALGSLTHAQTVGLASQLAAAKAAVKPFTIDVATVGAAADGNKAAGTTYVRLGLGSLEIAASNIDFTVALGSSTGTSAPTVTALSQELGAVHMGNLVMSMNGNSTVDIYSTNQKVANLSSGSGVVLDLNVIVDKLTMASMSWGNTAGSVTGTSASGGAQASTSAGYVGFSNMNITDLRFTGPVSIQVATAATSAADVTAAATALAGSYSNGSPTAATPAAISAYYYSLYSSIGTGKAMGSSFVHIGLGTGNSVSGATLDGSGNLTAGALGFSMGSMTADVKVADNAGLTGGGTYGSMGMSNLKVGMNGWVNIGTH